MTADSLQITVTTDKAVYRSGEPVRMTLALANRSGQERTVDFTTGQRYDFKVDDRAGATVWSWGADRMFPQVLGTERLPPGGSRDYTAEFNGRLPPGTYTVTGLIVARGAPRPASSTITIQ